VKIRKAWETFLVSKKGNTKTSNWILLQHFIRPGISIIFVFPDFQFNSIHWINHQTIDMISKFWFCEIPATLIFIQRENHTLSSNLLPVFGLTHRQKISPTPFRFFGQERFLRSCISIIITQRINTLRVCIKVIASKQNNIQRYRRSSLNS
jgi:hypothetical protein